MIRRASGSPLPGVFTVVQAGAAGLLRRGGDFDVNSKRTFLSPALKYFRTPGVPSTFLWSSTGVGLSCSSSLPPFGLTLFVHYAGLMRCNVLFFAL